MNVDEINALINKIDFIESNDSGVFQQTFYEKLSNYLPINRYILVLIVGLMIFTTHYVLLKIYYQDQLIFNDYSYILSIIFIYTCSITHYCTDKLREFTYNLYKIFKISKSNSSFIEITNKCLSTPHQIKYGLLFGILNLSFGILFGVLADNNVLYLSLIIQFFIVAFVSGVAVTGLRCVYLLLNNLKSCDINNVDIKSSDKCGGTADLSDTLLIFSFVSLLFGLLMNSYIYNAPWTHEDRIITQIVMYIWMIFPHLIAIGALFYPIWKIHHILIVWKQIHEVPVSIKKSRAQNDLIYELKNSNKKNTHHMLLSVIYYNNIVEIHSLFENLNVWPFKKNNSIIYIITWFSSTLIPIVQFIDKINK